MAATLVKEGAFFCRVWKSLRGLFVKAKKIFQIKSNDPGEGKQFGYGSSGGAGMTCLFINHLEIRK